MATQPDIRFYDTSALLVAGEKPFLSQEKFFISSITLQELENIKTSVNKDADTKCAARSLCRLLEQYPESYEVIIHEPSSLVYCDDLDVNDDTKILSDALYAYHLGKHTDRIIFVTNDLCLKHIANQYFGSDMVKSVEEEADSYCGYKEINATDDVLASFYQNPSFNHFDLLINEYLILKNNEDEIIDIRVWTGSEHRYLQYETFDSLWFGKVKPYNQDTYQKLLFDSLSNNQITMVRGPAGSGKSIISLGYLMSELDKDRLDKIIVFCNTVATANSAKLGFYPGSRNEKLLDSQIGNLLASKFGGRDAVEQLINSEKMLLLPLSDIRGFDTTNMRAGVYISEAQNLDKSLMKLALQRIGEDCICIIDGDEQTQVDMPQYGGKNNGMRRASQVFRGHDIYGEVRLQNIHRSKISAIADLI